MAFFRDEKSSLHYLVRGYGEPLLLIHGLGGSGVSARALAAALKADIVVVRGSRHGTPFDSVEATNASLLALLTDQK
jgi:hypothetical protein